MNKLKYFGLIVLAISFMSVLVGGTAHAAPGEITNEYPNSSLGAEKSYADSELCSNDTTKCMKGAVTYAYVLVPDTFAGKTISITIEDGCDSTPVDNNISSGDSLGYTADTQFDILNAAGVQLATVVTPANQGNGNINIGCAANADLNISFVMPAGGTAYDHMVRLYFRATALRAQADGYSYYLNFYRLIAQTPGVYLDKADALLPCPLLTYPKSCPDVPKYPGGKSFSSVGQPGSGRYGQQAIISTVCNTSVEQLNIQFFDLDVDKYNQPDIRGQIIETNPDGSGSVLIPDPSSANGDGANGFPLSFLPLNYGGDNAFADLADVADAGLTTSYGFPPGSRLNLKPNKIYTIKILNLDKRNTLQILINTGKYHPTRNCEPLGFYDSCSLIAGVTHFYGWAYDADSTTSAEPPVNLTLTGTANFNSGDIPTDKDLRTVAIEDYLSGTPPGSGGVRTGMPLDKRFYGFDWAMTGPLIGGTYTVGGIIRNAGGGADVPINISGFFANGLVPASCLPSPSAPGISCRVDVGALTLANVPNNFAPKFYVTNNGSAINEPITSGTVTLTLTGYPPSTGAFGVLPPGVETLVALNPPTATVANAGNYAVGASASAIAGPFVVNSGQCGSVKAPPPGSCLAGDPLCTPCAVGDPACIPICISGNTACPIVFATRTEPYFKIYGADTSTGSGFEASGSCTATVGKIYGFADGSGSKYRGAGTQYNAMAKGNIIGFFTAGNRRTSAVPPKGLSFANTSGNGDPTYGGGFGAGVPCITDYFSDPTSVPAPPNGGTRDQTVSETNSIGPFSTGSLVSASGKHRYLLTGNTTITGLTVPLGQQIAIYVKGDLTISDNIFLTPGASSTTDMPNLSVIVRGNIYITPNVKQIEGLFVAQPSNLITPSNGYIFTCANSGTLIPVVNLASTCATPLAINGSLVAQQIRFFRTNNSLPDSPYSDAGAAGEVPNFLTGSGGNVKASEVINYTPELFIAPSALRDPNLNCKSITCKYDSIYSLPPVY